jgi:hypothetical protein
VIECPELRAIFLMLREGLRDSDIPHRTTIRNRVLEMWTEHLKTLELEMKVKYFPDNFTSIAKSCPSS